MTPGSHMLAEAVGIELRRLRQRAGLSRSALARIAGTHAAIVSRVELGRNCATLEVARLHAEACGGSILDVARVVDRVCGLGRRRRASARVGRLTPTPR